MNPPPPINPHPDRRGPTSPSLSTRSLEIWRWEKGAVSPRPDEVAVEEPLEIRVRGRSVTVTMRTPGEDAELAAGFLLTEGVIRRREEILEIAHCQQSESPGNILNVFVGAEVALDLERMTRHVLGSSSCGLCGKTTLDSILHQFPPVTGNPVYAGEDLLGLPAQLRLVQPAFTRTGGLHAAALFDRNLRLVVAREDIGRHNAVDKVVGHGFLRGHLPWDHHLLLVSGRTSLEILQKALAAGIAVVAGVSAPSSLAVAFARESGQTLIGFLRDQSMNLYAHPHRVRGRMEPVHGK